MSHAAFVLLSHARDVSNAEENLRNQITALQSRLDGTKRSLERGTNLNTLGELQGTPAAYEAAVGALEAASTAFRATWGYLGDEFHDPANPEATSICLQEEFDALVTASPRLTKLTWKPST